MECSHFWAAWHTIRRWHIQINNRIHGRISKQTANSTLCIENVPSKCLCRWWYLFGYFAKSMESNVWCVSDFDLYTGIFHFLCFIMRFRNISKYFETFWNLLKPFSTFFNILKHSIIFIISFQSLLSDPNPNSPANSMAAQLYKENRREYEKRVKACVEQSFID